MNPYITNLLFEDRTPTLRWIQRGAATASDAACAGLLRAGLAAALTTAPDLAPDETLDAMIVAWVEVLAGETPAPVAAESPIGVLIASDAECAALLRVGIAAALEATPDATPEAALDAMLMAWAAVSVTAKVVSRPVERADAADAAFMQAAAAEIAGFMTTAPASDVTLLAEIALHGSDGVDAEVVDLPALLFAACVLFDTVEKGTRHGL